MPPRISIRTDDDVLSEVSLIGAKSAAQILDLTTSYLKLLDGKLQPLVTEEGRRVYVRAIVERVAAERAACAKK